MLLRNTNLLIFNILTGDLNFDTAKPPKNTIAKKYDCYFRNRIENIKFLIIYFQIKEFNNKRKRDKKIIKNTSVYFIRKKIRFLFSE